MNYRTQAIIVLVLWITLWLVLLFVGENVAASFFGLGSIVALLFNYLMDQSVREKNE